MRWSLARTMRCYSIMWLLFITGFLSLLCTVHLWVKRRGDRILRRLAWTLIIAVPGLGLLLYGGCYNPPSIQPESLRAHESSYI